MLTSELDIPQATAFDFDMVHSASGRRFPLTGEVLIGREIDCTIRLVSAGIRRFHAKITASDDGFFLEDLHSGNNTFLNDCRIGTGAWITLGDQLRFEQERFEIQGRQAASSRTVAKAPPVTADAVDASCPFTNEEVLSATRKLEENALARLQVFKEAEPDIAIQWEQLISKKPLFEALKQQSMPKVAAKPAPEPAEVPPRNRAAPGTAQAPQPLKAANTADEADGLITPGAAKRPQRSSPPPAPSSPVTAVTTESPPAKKPQKTPPKVLAPSQRRPSQGAVTRPNLQAPRLDSDPRLIVQTAPARGKSYALAMTGTQAMWTLGSSPQADIPLYEQGLDSLHAHIERMDHGFRIRATRQSSGLLINGKPRSQAILRQGDLIQVGRSQFVYREDRPLPDVLNNAKPPKRWRATIVMCLLVLSLLALAALMHKPAILAPFY